MQLVLNTLKPQVKKAVAPIALISTPMVPIAPKTSASRWSRMPTPASISYFGGNRTIGVEISAIGVTAFFTCGLRGIKNQLQLLRISSRPCNDDRAEYGNTKHPMVKFNIAQFLLHFLARSEKMLI